MKWSGKSVGISLLGYGLITMVVLCVVVVLALVGGGIMKLFGFTYQSAGSIVFYFVIAAVLGLPMELFAKALPQALLELGRLNQLAARVLFVVLDTAFTAISFAVVDCFMNSVSASDLAIWVLSAILALSCVKDIGKGYG